MRKRSSGGGSPAGESNHESVGRQSLDQRHAPRSGPAASRPRKFREPVVESPAAPWPSTPMMMMCAKTPSRITTDLRPNHCREYDSEDAPRPKPNGMGNMHWAKAPSPSPVP